MDEKKVVELLTGYLKAQGFEVVGKLCLVLGEEWVGDGICKATVFKGYTCDVKPIEKDKNHE